MVSVLDSRGGEADGQYGLTWTLWGGAMLCFLGFVSAMMVSVLDSRGVKQMGDENALKAQSKNLKITDMKLLPLSFWLLALAIMFFYNGVFPFVADASKFIYTKYGESDGLDQKQSSYLITDM